MIKATMIGHVESIDTSGNYENSLVVTDERIPETKFPNHIKFLVSSKKTELIDKIDVDDKIKVTFYVTGIAGESKKTGNPYQINKLMVSDIEVIEKSQTQGEQKPVDPDDVDDIPF